ncbi:hypothetical protein VIBNISFn27_480002 [Vibrio nigripulchritudo SFn27]|nr:hypothetical protein VIBNIMADA3020_910196 [Vibrio nigripulchritudo MADA3020]CCN88728.1 hypothetical protein VIBNISFn27_480002 [Vibrio nigripulchritudo SFn27]CCN95043.1 hypothetical protein VIBNIENn2_470119 [Vibrio nigripulchritudo ENn2]CCO52390.1 hypothetical protein VIBNIWn13_330002 [Vibrio nigripulchritudo Wn13]
MNDFSLGNLLGYQSDFSLSRYHYRVAERQKGKLVSFVMFIEGEYE